MPLVNSGRQIRALNSDEGLERERKCVFTTGENDHLQIGTSFDDDL